jgi:hypothetical protein
MSTCYDFGANFPSITISECVFTEYPFSRGVYPLNTVLVGAYPLNTVLVGEYPLNTVLVGAYPLYTVNTPYSLNTYLDGPDLGYLFGIPIRDLNLGPQFEAINIAELGTPNFQYL